MIRNTSPDLSGCAVVLVGFIAICAVMLVSLLIGEGLSLLGFPGLAVFLRVCPMTAAPATTSAAVAAAKEAHRLAHNEYVAHEWHCALSEAGWPCKRCGELADAADDAGKRWEMAERRAALGAQQGVGVAT